MSSRRFRLGGLTKTAAALAVGAVLAGGATAVAAGDSLPAHGNGGGEPPNVGQVETQVEQYYGDSIDAAGHHHFSQDSAWARQTTQAIQRGERFLRSRASHVTSPAIVLDVDDTSEVTYGWEVDNQFAYDPVKNEQAIDNNEFPAIKPTLRLAQWAAAHHVKVYFLTGRPEHQRAATLHDLSSQGYPEPAALFLKSEGTRPPYLQCAAAKCTTIEYKSQTRAHIESLGNTIVLNVGDQYSDLKGDHAMRAVKLPNPMYYLP
ncbi:MAG: HAD family acid phosphatase [Sciscionella sp.]